MKCAVLCLICLLGVGFASPVERVVKLLEDLKSKIVADSDSETQTYNKFACWCEKTSARKAGLVVTGGDNLRSLGQQILKLKGEVATLTAEITSLAKKIKDSTEEQESLTAIRSKENAKYQSESAETKEALGALQEAIKVLAQATTPGAKKEDALLQEDSGLQSRDAVKAALNKLPTSAAISPKHMSILSEFARAQHGYAPQSASIQGILGDMYLTFSSDLQSSTIQESTKNADFEKTISSMEQEVIDLTSSKEDKEGKKASAESLLADTTASYDDSEAQMKADTLFFDSTKDQCEAKASEWSTRKALRAEELEGVNKALELLTSDDARELFSKSIKPGIETFLQVASEDSESPSVKAYSALRNQARKTKSLRLASLAASVRLAKVGHFDKVLKAIDDMVTTLKDEGAADIAKKDQCNNEYQDVASKVGDLSWKIEKNEAAIDKLEKLIEMRTAEKTQTEEEIKSVDQEMKDMTATREAEHEEFQTAKKDDEDAIALLTQAKDALSSFYANHSIAMGPIQGSVKLFGQEPAFDVSKDQAPEAKFSDKGSHKGQSKGIVSILTMIIEDLEDEVKNGVKDEVSSQTEYEKAMATAKKLREELRAKKVNLETAIAKRTKDKTEENKDMKANGKDKSDELKYKDEIKPDCDWIVKNFEGRATARAAEMNGLISAKEFLAGKAPKALLEQKVTFDDDALANVKFLGMRQ
jgi:hypothetical protein